MIVPEYLYFNDDPSILKLTFAFLLIVTFSLLSARSSIVSPFRTAAIADANVAYVSRSLPFASTTFATLATTKYLPFSYLTL